jgi:hypothetical protein
VLPNGDQHAVLLVPASPEEVAAANALAVSQPASPRGHTFAKDPENFVSSSRSRLPKMLRQTRRVP